MTFTKVNVKPPKTYKTIVFAPSTGGGMFVIRHKASRKCLYPKGGRIANQVQLVFANKCGDRKAVFRWTRKRSLESVAMKGYCIHPNGGSSKPRDGTTLVFYRLCNQRRLAFRYQYRKRALKHKTSSKCVQLPTNQGRVAVGTAAVLKGCRGGVKMWMQFEFMGM